MSRQLPTSDGKRKYLTQDEQSRFLNAAAELERGEVRTFSMLLAYSGCRISEALETTPERIDLSAKAITFRTLKQRNRALYRAVPVPDDLLEALELVHSIRKNKRSRKKTERLWSWGRSQATNHIWSVMALAGIEGEHASPKGLRHGFGVRMAQKTRNPRLVQKLLGHRSLETTAIYMDLVGEEGRQEVVNAW